MSPRVGNSPAPAVSRSEAPTKAKAPAAAPPKAKPDSDFKKQEKKAISLSGRFKPVARPQGQVDPELAKLVGNLRTAVQAGGARTGKAAIDAALKAIGPPSKDTAAQTLKLGKELEKLRPEERKAVWDKLPAKVKEAAIKSLNTPNANSPAIAMVHAQSMSDADLKAAAAQMRAGTLTNEGMQLSVASELAARTQWGKDNPDQVAKQRELVVSGKVTFKNGRGAARTETDGTISLDSKLARSPEGLAATLAHEGTHSAHATGWGMDSSVYREETTGNLAGARVWSEIGDKNDQNLGTNMRDGLNEYAEQFKAHGEDGVQARVAAEYAMEASERFEKNGTESEKAKVLDVVAELTKDPGAVKAMKPEHALEVATALARVQGNEDAFKALGEAFKNLPGSTLTALDEMLKRRGFDRETRNVLTDA